MENSQERYGRQASDRPCLINEISVIGKRAIYEAAKNALPPHSLKDFQIIYVTKGRLEIWLDGQLHLVKENEFIIIRPYEVMTYLNGTLPKGIHYFIQINLSPLPRSLDKDLLNSLSEILRQNFLRTIKVKGELDTLFENLLREHRNDASFSTLCVQNLCALLFISILRFINNRLVEPKDSKDSYFIHTVNQYIDDHICERLSVKKLASHCQISENQLRLNFKRLLKKSPQQLINQKRIEYAKQQLCNDKISITDISFQMGFSSSQYFSLFFKKNTSLTPFEFRSSMRTLMQKSTPDIVSAKDASAQIHAHFNVNKVLK